jgi:hypothetical protein
MDLQQVHNVLEALPFVLLHQGDIKPLIVDTGCSQMSLGLLMISSLALLRSSVTQIGWTELMQS